ncbi:hypothetical protein ANN_18222 [Periplaneta americana]|uniref:Uncharacterized protein n=1 Tax=Periplaneta americana TaxID=6978 RepID=A0ABQ8SPE8_PERAM|nr:hypothetical protein ANN_18222 [Periplaneta americana]
MTLYCASIYYERITTDLISLEGVTLDLVQASDLTPMQHSAGVITFISYRRQIAIAVDKASYLDRRFPDRWIGRGGPIAWPPRSPDLNPHDFYLWGHLKSLAYLSPVPDLESLRNRIVACSEDIRNTPGVGIVFAGQ